MYEKAVLMYDIWLQYRDSLINQSNRKAAIRNQVQIEYDKKALTDSLRSENEKDKIVMENEIELNRQQNQKMVLYIGLSLVIIFSIILFNRFRIIRNQKSLIEIKEKETQTQKQVIEEKQKEILDSINYAKRIQYTLLAHDQFLHDNIPDHFVYFNPKDIVSGDFYWATKVDSRFYLATCDSTGHGIPGAFMSLLNIGFLSEAINEKDITSPDKVFDYVRMKLTGTISRDGQKDGFDGILVCFDQATKQITYSAANNAPVLIQNSSFIELPADRMPVGLGERKENFSLFTIEAKPGDVLYLYTDGYADQFGGPKGKKFKYKQLNELLVEIHSKSSSEQQEALKHTFDEWKGNLEQVDDVCVIGIRIS
jgi:serine phosphatase RsbU (regulator of sigma subunit)